MVYLSNYYIQKEIETQVKLPLVSESDKGKELIMSSLTKVSHEDSSDCAKKLICELQAKEELSWDEQLIKESIPAQV